MNRLDTFGATFGIEEEYHLVDAETLALRSIPQLAEFVAAGGAGPQLHPEMLTSQLEAVTEVCTDLAEARVAVARMRATAADAAAPYGAKILATSTHPTSAPSEIRMMRRDRYDRLVERHGSVVQAFNLCGCHVHVSVPDLESAVAVMAHARPYLPLLNALTASSPFHDGVDTGYQSFRIAWLSLWQQGGPPPHLESVADYHATIGQLIDIGLVGETSEVLWELRPSTRFPTLEFRMGDVCTDLDDALLFAALTRALVRTLGERVQAGVQPPVVHDTVLRAARWRAARYGMSGGIWDPVAGGVIEAGRALSNLLDALGPTLRHFGMEADTHTRAERLVQRGTSAQRQRAGYAATGDLRAVIDDAVTLTALS